MGPVILARADVAPYAVKIHGSALEYTVKPHPERFMPYALEGSAPARGCWSALTTPRSSLFEALSEEPSLPERTRLGPPGVDIHEFRPRSPTSSGCLPPGAAWGGEQGSPGSPRAGPLEGPDRELRGQADRLEGRGPAAGGLAARGRRVPDARLVIVGFGTYYDALVRFVEALASRDLEALRDIAARGRELEGGPPASSAT